MRAAIEVDNLLQGFGVEIAPADADGARAARNAYFQFGKGSVIQGLDEAGALQDVEIFHAGTKLEGSRITANGGRVLGVAATGKSVAEAHARAYAAVDKIDWPGGFCRRDIGYLAVGREKSGP